MTQKFVASKHGLVSWEPCINGIIGGKILATEGRWQMHDVEVVKGQGRALTAAEFSKLAEVPPEIEWFANLRNPNTRKAYEIDLREFRRFVGIARPEEFRTVTRAHVIAWRKDLERRACAPTTIQRKLAALSSLFAYLAEHNAVLHNPVDGVKRHRSNRQQGTPPALSYEQAR